MRKIVSCFLLLFVFAAFSSCSSGNEFTYKNKYYKIIIDSSTGSLKALWKNGANLINSQASQDALFDLRFRDQADSGRIYEFDAQQASQVSFDKKGDSLFIDYSGFPNAELSVRVTVALDKESPLMNWNITVDNNTDYTLDHIDFPNIAFNNDLVATGGTGHIFWPAQEGVVIEDMRIRESGGWLSYKAVEYPYVGWGGLYPSSTQMQYMAYYNADGGVYLAAHDAASNPKGLEFYRTEDNAIKFQYRLFAGGSGKGVYKMPYDMILGVFYGDWYDASAIYRAWHESSSMPMPPKIKDNKMLPDWYFESPVIVTYPVRGHKDMGDMTPNEFFPYTNGLKYIDKYNEAFDSKIMALLMHWEGSAPWAPPYVWPPYGGVSEYLKFVRGLHEKGNLAGLYASGIGYTLRSNTDTTYNMYKEYKDKSLSKVMKVAPDGTLATNGVCTGPMAQRIGYDMCPANDFVADVVVDQIEKIVETKTDYIQYFDQNLGGACYACYGTEHGHPYGPGLWQIKEMQHLYEKLMPVIEKSGYKPIIGCEAAAGEGNLPYLLFNDARATINLFAGTPVPAYSFVYHEYVNNFMGNQNSVSYAVNMEKCPMNLLQRLAYGFTAGDMMTVVIKGDGQIIWDWGTLWENDVPNQENAIQLIRNLNSWRKGAGKDFLVMGKMQKPISVGGVENLPMITNAKGYSINFPTVFTSNWELENGDCAQFLVNYLPQEQTVWLNTTDLKDAKLIVSSDGKEIENIASSDKYEVKIAPLSAVMISYRCK